MAIKIGHASIDENGRAKGKDGVDGQDGADGKDGINGVDGKDGKDGAPGPKGDKGDKGDQGPQGLKGDKGDQGDPGKDGIDGKDGTDGISITNVQIDNSNNLICTLSDGTTINAGQLPSEGRGLLQVDNVASLPQIGSENILYYIKDTEEIYVWDTANSSYKKFIQGIENSGISQSFSILSLDGVSSLYNAPIDDTNLNIYLNGLYLTEGIDYTIDKTQSPNKILFNQILEQTDLCTVVWFEGGGSSGVVNNFATKEDIDKLFANIDLGGVDGNFEFNFATKSDIDNLFVEGVE